MYLKLLILICFFSVATQKVFANEWQKLAENNDVNALQKLYANKPTATLEHGNVMWQMAILNNSIDVLSWLKTNDIKINQNKTELDFNPWHLALSKSDVPVLEWLAKNKITGYDALDESGSNIYHHASQRANVFSWLRNWGFKGMHVKNSTGRSGYKLMLKAGLLRRVENEWEWQLNEMLDTDGEFYNDELAFPDNDDVTLADKNDATLLLRRILLRINSYLSLDSKKGSSRYLPHMKNIVADALDDLRQDETGPYHSRPHNFNLRTSLGLILKEMARQQLLLDLALSNPIVNFNGDRVLRGRAYDRKYRFISYGELKTNTLALGALGTGRKLAQRTLVSNLNYSGIRQKIIEEKMNRFAQHGKLFWHYPSEIGTLSRNFQNNQINEKGPFYSPASLYVQPENLEQFIETELLGTDWISAQATQYGLLKAIAHLNNVELLIWTDGEQEGSLRMSHYLPPASPILFNTLHLRQSKECKNMELLEEVDDESLLLSVTDRPRTAFEKQSLLAILTVFTLGFKGEVK